MIVFNSLYQVGAIKPRNTSYSPQTGRLIPSPYRAASNGSSKRGQRAVRCLGGPLQHIAEEPDVENAVFNHSYIYNQF